MNNYFEEKEQEWGKQKWGMFSASRISELLILNADGSFGKGAMTYINQVACECYTEYEHNEFKGTWEMRQGKINEPLAAQYYTSIMKSIEIPGRTIRWEYYGGANPLFKKYNDFSGTSPDQIGFLDEKPYILAEFKCPSRDMHWQRLQQISKYRPEQEYLWLREYHIDYYAQMQFNMLNFGCKIGHWVSYNQYFKEPDTAIIITIPEDKTFQHKLKILLGMANTEKNKIINSLKNRHGNK